MSSFYYASIHGITTNITDTFEIEKGLYLTEDEVIKSQIIDRERGRCNIGQIETTSIFNTPVLSFAVSNHSVDTTNEKERLRRFILTNHFFCLSLWLVKDNSAHLQLGFLNYGNNRERYHSNYIAHINSHADSTHLVKSFDESELKKAKFFYSKIKDNLSNDSTNGFTQLVQESTRISRALYYLQAARMYEDLAIKITFYFVSLEALFLDNNKSPHNQVALKASHLLEPHDDERRNHIRSMIIRNYDLRSSTVHGNRVPDHIVKKENKKLIAATEELDNLTRKVLTNILTTDQTLKPFQT